MLAHFTIQELIEILHQAQLFLDNYQQKGDKNSSGLAPICAIALTFYDKPTAHRIAKYTAKPKAMGMLEPQKHKACIEYEQKVRESLQHYLGPDSGKVINRKAILLLLIMKLRKL